MLTLPKRNIAKTQGEEKYRPRPLKGDGWRFRVRLWFDLQAGSIQNDLQQILQHCRGRVLDVGCGSSPWRTLLPSDVEYLGIDSDRFAPEFGYRDSSVRYVPDDDWGLDGEQFDTILCTEVLEHIPEPVVFLTRVINLLAPDGMLVMTVPFSARWHFISADYYRYTSLGLSSLLKQAGFSQIRITARGNPLTVAAYKVAALWFSCISNFLEKPRISQAFLSVLGAPIAIFALCIGNWSLDGDWGEDCLGYTVITGKGE